MQWLLQWVLLIVSLIAFAARGDDVCQGEGTCSGLVQGTQGQIGSERTQKDFYDRATHYDTVWGGRLRPGYFPHLVSGGYIRLNVSQAADMMTQRMVEIAHINHTSTVLDMGCGFGASCVMIAQMTGASCTGLDLSTTNVARANSEARKLPHLKLDFVEGSFTDLPAGVASKKFSHIFSQVALVHVHKLLPQILQQAQSVLADGGIMVINDYLGSDVGVSNETREHVYKRLHFDQIFGHKKWRHVVEDSNLSLLYYENLDAHMAEAYSQAADTAERFGIDSADGTPMADNYRGTVRAIEAREIGMNLALLKPEAGIASSSCSSSMSS